MPLTTIEKAIRQTSVDEVKKIVTASISYEEVTDGLGVRGRRYNKHIIQDYCRRHKIRYSHLKGRRPPTFLSDREVFRKNSIAKHSVARRRYKKHKLPVCERCGSIHDMELHHKNTDATDHRLSNLQWLCHNCHRTKRGIMSDTKTFHWHTGKNKSGSKHTPTSELSKIYISLGGSPGQRGYHLAVARGLTKKYHAKKNSTQLKSLASRIAFHMNGQPTLTETYLPGVTVNIEGVRITFQKDAQGRTTMNVTLS